MQTNNDVTLRVNGTNFAGWLDVEIGAGIERQARDFKLNITRKWPGATDIPRRVAAGDICEVYIGADKVLTGYVDATPISYDAQTISVGVNGRSKTADIIDCSANYKNGQWRNVKIERIAKDLAGVYGIQVLTQVSTGSNITDHQIDTGETAFESIGRLLALRQLLSTDDAEGNLVLINAGSGGRAGTALEYGKNILSADTSLDYKDVFASYTAKGQRSGNDYENAETITSISASAADSSVKRPRNLIIQMSGQINTLDCQQRVKYERLYRAAKALETTYTVQGWRQGDGSLWVPNQTVKIIDPVIGFDTEMLIVEVTYSLNSGGTTCSLKVAPKEGFIPSPEVTSKEKAKKAGKGGDSWAEVK
jgi:prophage tail gpP-like protein